MQFHEDTHINDIVPPSEYEIERNKPMPSFNHAMIQANLITEINVRYRKEYSLASELSLDLSDWFSVPDISLYPKRPLDFNNDRIKVQEVPRCVIEIVSPTQSLNELTEKANAYFAHGVQSCWLVLLPLTTICVFSSPNDYTYFRIHETLQDEVLGISLPLQAVFE